SGTAVRTSTTQRAGVARPSRVTSAALRLRAGPSTSTAIELVLAPGARLTVAGSVVRSGRTWYHVAALGRIGWVAGEYTRAA
ncbi:MAG TPA: SH3 domain-containing protein, partial [Candidatus Dormibacteraeota bacterium]|nr:SH3 domain-containing protein [Candidatus Dormibacteraeota bacterium]